MKFKQFLKIHGMKQIRLSKELGVSTQLITNWVKGYSKPSLVAIKQMSALFNVDAEQIIECFVN